MGQIFFDTRVLFPELLGVNRKGSDGEPCAQVTSHCRFFSQKAFNLGPALPPDWLVRPVLFVVVFFLESSLQKNSTDWMKVHWAPLAWPAVTAAAARSSAAWRRNGKPEQTFIHWKLEKKQIGGKNGAHWGFLPLILLRLLGGKISSSTLCRC